MSTTLNMGWTGGRGSKDLCKYIVKCPHTTLDSLPFSLTSVCLENLDKDVYLEKNTNSKKKKNLLTKEISNRMGKFRIACSRT